MLVLTALAKEFELLVQLGIKLYVKKFALYRGQGYQNERSAVVLSLTRPDSPRQARKLSWSSAPTFRAF